LIANDEWIALCASDEFNRTIRLMNVNSSASYTVTCLRSRIEQRGNVILSVVLLVCGWLYFGAARPPGGAWFSREPSGYYGLLTAGFCSGHLYAAIDPHPGLLALDDPYDPVANAPYRVHDMSFWRGHYYLYYGVTPVLIFFWPIVATTGWYPTEALAVALFSWGSVAAAIVLLSAMRRRYFPKAPISVFTMAALCLAFANPVATLTEGLNFYQVPIACAAGLEMLMFGAIYLALRGGPGAGAWLAAASVLCGLAIGARPNYVLSAVVLFVPFVVLVWRERQGRWFRATIRFGAMAGGPLLVSGLGLMLYNWLRFDSPTEFGMRYSLGGAKILNTHLMALANVWPHVGDYLLTPGIWSRYFPFFKSPVGEPHGALRYAPWLSFAALAWFFGVRRDLRGGCLALVAAMTLAVLANLSLLACFFGLTNRYPPDFVPVWLLLAGIGALAMSASLAKHAPRWTRTGKSVLAIGCLVTLFFALAVFVGHLSEPRRVLPLARFLNWPAFLWERANGVHHGSLRLELDVPQQPIGHSEPLIETGVAGDQRDWVQIDYLSDDRARIGFFHAGLGLLSSREFTIPSDRRLTVEAQFGALLPPFAHPLFSDWTWQDYVARRREVWVRVNDQEVLRAVLDSYDSPPQCLTVGATRWISGGLDGQFSGRVRAMDRLPLPPIIRRGSNGMRRCRWNCICSGLPIGKPVANR
jgi:hypothetical protein